MNKNDKLKILADAAKYDVSCASSGSNRENTPGGIGNASKSMAGICHTWSADGRCISLMKVLYTNHCIYDCAYCANRRSNDIPRAAFTSEELAGLTINFYRRNYIEGLFLSSAVIQSPDYTMEMLCHTLSLVRNKYRFNGYIHVKAIPGADPMLVRSAGLLADRMSVNIELPSEASLKLLAPEKSKRSILAPMSMVKNGIIQSKAEMTMYKHAPAFVPAGQSTQLIVGATTESDHKIITLAQGLYDKYALKRVFYSAYIPINPSHHILPASRAPLLREHRLYQADWLLRFYRFRAEELLAQGRDLDLNMDPKCAWAINNLDQFPVEVNTAEYETLLRVPGIGVRSAQKIVTSRRAGRLDFETLRKMNIVLKRAKYFITCSGRMYQPVTLKPETLTIALSENKINETYEQLTLSWILRNEGIKCLTGEL